MKTNPKSVYPGVVGCKIEKFEQLVKELCLVIKEKREVRNYLLNSVPQIDFSVGQYFVTQFETVFRNLSKNCTCRAFDSTEFFRVIRLMFNDETLDEYSSDDLDKELSGVLKKARKHLKSMNRKNIPVDVHRMAFYCPRSAN